MHNVEVDDTSVFDSNERHRQSFNEKMPKDSTISDWKELITKKWSAAVRWVADPDGDPEQKEGEPTNATWIFHRCHRIFASIIKNWRANVAPYHNWFMDKWRSENERSGAIKEHTVESLWQYFIDKEHEFDLKVRNENANKRARSWSPNSLQNQWTSNKRQRRGEHNNLLRITVL